MRYIQGHHWKNWDDSTLTIGGARHRCYALHPTPPAACDECHNHFQTRPERHHKDRNPLNNERDNIAWLCGHCHRMAHPYRTHTKPLASMAYRRGEMNPGTTLTEADVLKIRAMRSSGMHYHAIAGIFGISKSSAYRIANDLTWKHVYAGT